MDARNIEEIVVNALKKELVRLSGAADRAKAALDEYMSTGTEMIAIHEELTVIVKSKKTGKAVIDKLAALQDRESKVNKILKKSLPRLSDKQITLEIERDSLMGEISMMEYRWSMRKTG